MAAAAALCLGRGNPAHCRPTTTQFLRRQLPPRLLEDDEDEDKRERDPLENRRSATEPIKNPRRVLLYHFLKPSWDIGLARAIARLRVESPDPVKAAALLDGSEEGKLTVRIGQLAREVADAVKALRSAAPPRRLRRRTRRK